MLRTQTAPHIDLLSYYAQPGPMTDPHDQAYLLNNLPTDIPSLVKVVQGVMVHNGNAGRIRAPTSVTAVFG